MDSDSSPSKKSKSRGRGRPPRGATRGRPRGRGRGKRAVIESDEESDEEQQMPIISTKNSDSENEKPPVSTEEITIKPEYDLEADISQLQAPTFTTINRGPPEPMLRLNWSQPVNLIGEKVLNPMIHCCDKCLKPILIYGRLIPCKHVFCLGCGRKEDGQLCPRCREKVVRVEQTSLGNVFMCTHGGSRYGNDGCRRTYLSQRDLQAHINHRHLRLTSSSAVVDKEPQKISTVPLSHPTHQLGGSSRNLGSTQHIPVLNTRSNLVSVPIQDTPPPPPPPPPPPQQQPATYFASVAPPSTATPYNTFGAYQTPQTSYHGAQNYYASSGAAVSVTSGAFPNFQQPPPNVLPPVHGHQYDAHGTSTYNNQWNSGNPNSYYR